MGRGDRIGRSSRQTARERLFLGVPYLGAITAAGALVYTSETLRGWELAAFVLLCPVASVVLGYLAADTWAYSLAVVGFLINALPVPIVLSQMGAHDSDAQGGFLPFLMLALCCLCLAVGHLGARLHARTT